jgi:GNAT superfamily N-acetyltransferase
MEIRPANTQDLDRISELYITNHRAAYRALLSEAYFSRLTPDYARDKWTRFLHDPEKVLRVAYEGAAFLGFAAGMKDEALEHTWYLESLHVVPAAQGKGVGTALIKAMKRLAKERDCLRLSICIVKGNDAAGNLYRTLGAEHLLDFEDDFCGTVSHSEKLIWNRLDD